MLGLGLLALAVVALPRGAVGPHHMAEQLVGARLRARMTALQCRVGKGTVHVRVSMIFNEGREAGFDVTLGHVLMCRN